MKNKLLMHENVIFAVAVVSEVLIIGCVAYCLGRRDQVQEFLDVALEDGSITAYCYNRRNKKIMPLHLSTD